MYLDSGFEPINPATQYRVSGTSRNYYTKAWLTSNGHSIDETYIKSRRPMRLDFYEGRSKPNEMNVPIRLLFSTMKTRYNMRLSSPEYLHSMNETALTFIGYIIWMVLLLMTLISLRAKAVLQGKKASNDFLPDGTDLSPFVARLTRVHANCYEFFPLFGGILLFTMVMEITQVTNGLAYYFLVARVLQGVLHLISTHEKAVLLRLVFFAAQIAIVIIWMVKIIRMNLL